MLNLLRGLDNDGLFYGIAKVTKIDAQFDHSKNLAALVSLITIVINLYIKVDFGLAIGVTLLLIVPTLIKIYLETRKRVSAVYLKSLLEQVKAEKEKEKAS